MWVMPPQSLDGLKDALLRALTYANGTPVYEPSANELSALIAVYRLYEELGGQPHKDLCPATLDSARPHLHDAYNEVQVRGRLADLRAHVLSSAQACPYCGFGEPRDLDHYLPRSKFGELAIYPNNLVPSCGPCNTAKRAIVPGVSPGPGLIHPYFEDLPDLDFLSADVTFVAGSLDVVFTIDQKLIAPALAAKLQFQLDRLKLNDRYTSQINKFIHEQRTAIMMLHESGSGNVKKFLLNSAASLAISFHRNDWRAALMRALASTPEFCAHPEAYLGERNPSV